MIRVAIVEDDAAAAEELSALVGRYGKERGTDLEVRTYRDGLTFLAVAAGKCDIVFMDIEMPDLDGRSCARRTTRSA